MTTRRFLLFLAAAILAGLSSMSAQGQVAPDVTYSSSSEIDVFGMYNNSNPDYGPGRNNGWAAGGNYRLPKFHLFTPSVTGRVNYNYGNTVNEHSYLFGLLANFKVHHFRPYAGAIGGLGWIEFPLAKGHTSRASDDDVDWGFVGGTDYRISRHLYAIGEYNYQFFTLNSNTHADLHFSPNGFNVGLEYRIR